MGFESQSWKAKLKTWLLILSAIPAFLIIVAILQVIAGFVFALITRRPLLEIGLLSSDFPMAGKLISYTIQLISVLIIIQIYWVKIFKNSYASIGFESSSETKKELLQGFLTGVFLIGTIFLALLLTHQIEVEHIEFSSRYFFFHMALYLVVGFNEELLFRGYLLGTTKKLANKYLVLAIFALLFSFVHFLSNDFDLFPIINIFLAGIILGQYYIHTNRLWYSISLHFTWNFFQGPVFGSNVSGHENMQAVIHQKIIGQDWITGGSFGFEGSVIMTGLLILLIIYFEFYLRKKAVTSAQ